LLNNLQPYVQCGRPATPSGRIELASDWLATRWGASARLPRYLPSGGADRQARQLPAVDAPLTLISPASASRISSTLLGRGGLPGEAPPLLMHPSDAAARGLVQAQPVRVHNRLGAVHLVLQVTDAVPPGVVASEKGAWCASGLGADGAQGQTISALCAADARADLADGACFNDTQVLVHAAA
jgi:anaerobic selenocysteine-containing dehydrogenase